MTILLAGGAAAPFMIGYSILVSLYRALYLSTLWSWFVVPLGAPELPLMHAAGILLIVMVIRPVRTQSFHDVERNRKADIAWVKAHVTALDPRPETDEAIHAAVDEARGLRVRREFMHVVTSALLQNFVGLPLVLAVAYILHRLM